MRRNLRKPIQVRFCDNKADLEALQNPSSGLNQLICLSVSAPADLSIARDFLYVHGAGDDAENWALGLTPELFWANESCFSDESTDKALEKVARDIVYRAKVNLPKAPSQFFRPVRLTSASPPFFIGPPSAITAAQAGSLDVEAIIFCRDSKAAVEFAINDEESIDRSVSILRCGHLRRKLPLLSLSCPQGKLGSRALRTELGSIAPFMKSQFVAGAQPRLLFACATGLDLSIGVALAVACLHMDDYGHFVVEGVSERERHSRDGKTFVRKRLVQILKELGVDDHGGSEGKGLRRITLTAVNQFVVERPRLDTDECQDTGIHTREKNVPPIH